MAEYVVEFGKDGRPVEADGRLDAAPIINTSPSARNSAGLVERVLIKGTSCGFPGLSLQGIVKA